MVLTAGMQGGEAEGTLQTRVCQLRSTTRAPTYNVDPSPFSVQTLALPSAHGFRSLLRTQTGHSSRSFS